MRRTISCLLTLTLLFGMVFGVAGTAQAATDYSTVRVRLSTGSVTNMTIPVSGNYFIQENGAAFSGGTLSVKLSGGKITVTHSKAGQLYSGTDVNIMREKMDPGAGYLRIATTHGTKSYLGHLRLRVSSGYIQAINTVPLAHYLYGVVAYEMNDNFPLEALKAQAVAAKCYVLANMSPTSHYDIGDTSSDQVYKGYESSYRNVIRAVDATWNVGLYLGNSILCSYFAASNGGETILPSDAWSGTNRYQWDKAYDRREDPYDLKNPLSRAGEAYFPKDGDDDRDMTRTASNYLRTRAANALASAGYAGVTVTNINSIDSFEATGSSTAQMQVEISWEAGGNGGVTNLSFALSFSDIATNVMGVSSLRLYEIEEDRDGYTITAGRYGHGVGLSQRGAEQMANERWDYEEILDFYYPGAKLKEMDVSEVADPVNDKANAQQQQPSQGGSAVATAVTTGGVNMRSGPGTGYTKLGQIPKGTTVSVYARSGGWSQVLYNGALVYVSDDYLQITETPTQQPEAPQPDISGNTVVAYGEVTASTLNFRASAVSGAVLQKLTRGDQLNIYGYVENSTWYYANAKGQDGYVSAQYVKLTGTPADTGNAGNTGNAGSVDDAGTTVTPPTVNSDMAPAGSTAVTNHAEAYLHRNPAIVAKDIMGRFPLGTSLTLQGSSGEFYLVTISGMTGYVHKNDLTITDSAGASGSTGSAGSSGSTAASSLGETTGKVNFRKGPGTSYGSMGMLKKGTKLTIHGLSNGWYQVTVDGKDGYISASYVKVTQQGTGSSAGSSSNAASGSTSSAGGSAAATIGTGQMTTSNVNFRKGPGTSYGTLGKLSKGTALTLHSHENGWYYVTANGQQGYVSDDYVKVTSTGSSSGSGSSSGTVTDVTTSVGTGTTVWTGQVVNEWVRLRSSANFDTQDNIIGDYDVGTNLTITGRSGSWYKVQTPDGQIGFMHSDYVQVTGEITTYTAKATAKVNFRTAMSTSSSVIRTLSKGTAVTILGESGEWYKIQVGDQVGYAVKKYIG